MSLEGNRQNVTVELPGNPLSTLDVCSFSQAQGQFPLAQARHITVDQPRRQPHRQARILFDAEREAKPLGSPVCIAAFDLHPVTMLEVSAIASSTQSSAISRANSGKPKDATPSWRGADPRSLIMG